MVALPKRCTPANPSRAPWLLAALLLLLAGWWTPAQASGGTRGSGGLATLHGQTVGTPRRMVMRDSLRTDSTQTHASAQATDSAQIASPAAADSLGRAMNGYDSVYQYDGYLYARLPLPDTIGWITAWRIDPSAWTYSLQRWDSTATQAQYYDYGALPYATSERLGVAYSPLQTDDFFARPRPTASTPFPFVAVQPYLDPEPPLYSTHGHTSYFWTATNFRTNKGDLFARWFVTQNVNPALNLGFDLLHGTEEAEYVNLQSSVSRGRMQASYAKGRLYLNGYAQLGKLTFSDNGGIQEDRMLTDTVVEPETIPVRQAKAQSLTRSQDYLLDIGFDLLRRYDERIDSAQRILYRYSRPVLSLVSLHTYRRWARSWRNSNPYWGSDSLRAFDPPYISRTQTYDTVAIHHYHGRLGLAYSQQHPGGFTLPSLRAWVGYEHLVTIAQRPDQYLYPSSPTREASITAGMNADYVGTRLDLHLHLHASVLWARASEYSAYFGGVYRVFANPQALTVEGYLSLDQNRHSPLAKSYFSNTVRWDNLPLHPETGYTQSLSLRIPSLGIELGGRHRSYQNFTYLDSTSRPQQVAFMNVLGAWLEADFRRWGLIAGGRVLYQVNTHTEALSLPRVSLFARLGYEYELIKGVLTASACLEGYIRTAYRMDMWNSDLGAFRRQLQRTMGSYPMANAVLSLKWKNANVFAKVLHLHSGLLARRDYFAAPHYPDRAREWRFGVQWFFYN